jgi:hypothetical protein
MAPPLLAPASWVAAALPRQTAAQTAQCSLTWRNLRPPHAAADPQLAALDEALELSAWQLPPSPRNRDLLPALGAAHPGTSQLAHARRHAIQAAAAVGRLVHQLGEPIRQAAQEAEVGQAQQAAPVAASTPAPSGWPAEWLGRL